ncbi:MAG: sensor histidine kinase [Acidimicrobiales bacterium]
MISSMLGNVGQRIHRGDIALAGSLLGVAILSGIFVNPDRPDTVEPGSWWQWLLIATPPVLVAFRRVNPLAVTAMATAAQIGVWVSDLPEVLLPIIVILYSTTSDGGRRGLQAAVAASVALTAVTAIGVRTAEDVNLYQLPLIALSCGTAIALGVNAKRQRQAAGELAVRVAETRLTAEHERSNAIAAERSHIARELHDIIGHTLSVIAVRAEAADRVSKNKPEAASHAVADIAGAARAALTETRQVLAGLRDSASVDLAPPPDLDATKQLVAELAEAGINATLTERGCDVYDPPAVVAGGAYRIVQESLTNALKHGGSDVAIEVELVCKQSQLEVLIVNTVDRQTPSSGADATGAGIAGMTERAAVLGGTLACESTPGRFVVRAILPTGHSIQREAGSQHGAASQQGASE